MEMLTMTPQEKNEQGLQALERDHKSTKRDIQCITETWEAFTAEYLPYMKMIVQREKDRAELRKAIIKHSTIVVIGVVMVFVVNAVVHEAILVIKAASTIRTL
jgi:hypothetical protein